MNSYPVAVAAILALAYALPMQSHGASASTIYVGTYTGQKSEGIYRASFNPDSGTLSGPELAVKTPSPSFLAVHPSKPILYAVGEAASVGPRREGTVSAFAIEPGSGKLRLLGEQPSGGSGPCHLVVDSSGRCVLVANYNSGSVAAFPLDESGRIGPAKSVIQHRGSSVNPQRQKGPHAHHVALDSANRFALVCDLGLDQVLVYSFDAAHASLRPDGNASITPGAGPRHLAFQPGGDRLYLINEMGSSILAFNYSADDGSLQEFQTVSTLPADFQGQSTCAEIVVHPSGKYVYGSNRGHDSLAVFRTDPSTGKLTLVEHVFTGGKTPRHFAIDPSGKWLLAENQDSDSIVVFAINPESGKLTLTRESIEVGKPVCIIFHP